MYFSEFVFGSKMKSTQRESEGVNYTNKTLFMFAMNQQLVEKHWNKTFVTKVKVLSFEGFLKSFHYFH